VAILLAFAPSADAAVTRIRVEWSADSPQELSPRVSVFTEGSLTGWHTGPCARDPDNCKADPGFRWGEANPNAGGYPQVISFVDDRPNRARQVCFEVADAYAEELPTSAARSSQTNPAVRVVVTVTDPGGASRTRSFALARGGRSAVDCTPMFRPPRRLGARARPPAWWVQGRNLIKARGGRCGRSTRKQRGSDPRTGRPAGTYTIVSVLCVRRTPRFLLVRFGYPERCSSSHSNGNPEGDFYLHFCEIFSGQGRRAKPTRSSWQCQRFKEFDPVGRHVEKRADRAWSARRSRRSSKYRVRTLKGCLARRPGP
jgi:hypothetical protein